MQEFRASVYSPSSTDFPIVVIVFDQDDVIVKSHAVLSEMEGQAYIVETLAHLRQLDYLDKPS